MLLYISHCFDFLLSFILLIYIFFVILCFVHLIMYKSTQLDF